VCHAIALTGCCYCRLLALLLLLLTVALLLLAGVQLEHCGCSLNSPHWVLQRQTAATELQLVRPKQVNAV
jgi:hypothetical protein